MGVVSGIGQGLCGTTCLGAGLAAVSGWVLPTTECGQNLIEDIGVKVLVKLGYLSDRKSSSRQIEKVIYVAMSILTGAVLGAVAAGGVSSGLIVFHIVSFENMLAATFFSRIMVLTGAIAGSIFEFYNIRPL